MELKNEITNALKENSGGLDDTAEWTVNWKTTVGVTQAEQKEIFKWQFRDFPGSPMVENLPSKAGDEVSHLGQGTRGNWAHVPQLEKPVFQSPRATTAESVLTSGLTEFNLHPSP